MRGQTTLDFVIGVSIFLTIVLFTFTFVPGILEPFDVSEEENPSIADRTATTLSQDVLADPGEPGVLDRYCTVAFFEAGSDSPSDCRFTGQTVDDRLNVSEFKRVNVTLSRSDGGHLCWTDSTAPNGDPGLSESCDDDDVLLTGGPNRPSTSETTITARRVVSLQDEPVVLEVFLW